MSSPRVKVVVPQLIDRKNASELLTMVTAYDSTFASIVDEAGVDLILICVGVGGYTKSTESSSTSDHESGNAASCSACPNVVTPPEIRGREAMPPKLGCAGGTRDRPSGSMTP